MLGVGGTAAIAGNQQAVTRFECFDTAIADVINTME